MKLLFAFATLAAAAVLPELETASSRITAEGILKHIRVLASDDFGGRLPGTAGDRKSVAYLVAECRKLKLAPGNPDGKFVQNVPLWGMRSKGKVAIAVGGKEMVLEAGKDYVAWSVLPVRTPK